MSESTPKVNLVKSREEIYPRLRYNIESVSRIGNSFLINGWMVDPDNQCGALLVRKPAGKKAVVAQNGWIRFPRNDVKNAFPDLTQGKDLPYGFAFLAHGFADAEDATKLNLTTLGKNSRAFSELADVREIDSFTTAISTGFSLVNSVVPTKQLCDRFLQPLVNSSLPLRTKPNMFASESFGNVPHNPRLSIIIPIYGGLELMQYQIGNLAVVGHKDIEIVFAIDDPNLVLGALRLAKRQSMLQGLGIKIVAPDRNLGFAGINNFAAAYCTSPNLLFLNSDCFPVSSTWYRKLTDVLESDRFGLIGARLQFADGSLQHDGMAFERRPEFPGFVLNTHPYKNMPADLICTRPENEISSCVTAAFLAVKKDSFWELGGFDEGYVRGDFEDSDLCLQAISRGMNIGIIRDQKIFHLERQSQNSGINNMEAMRITLTNSARQTNKWQEMLDADLPKIEGV